MSASAHDIPFPALLAAFGVTAAAGWLAAGRRRGVPAFGAGLLAVQGALHLIFSGAGGQPAPHHHQPLSLVLLILWGYRMWWLRRPTKDRKLSVGRPMARGAWRKVPLPALLPLVATTALAGWFVPMLGISLLAFLVVDTALGAVARARA